MSIVSSNDESTDVQLDISKYEGSNTKAWRDAWGVPYTELIEVTKTMDYNGPNECTQADLELWADAPLLLAEVKRLRGLLMKGSEDYTTSYMDLRRIIEDVHWELTGDEHESNEARIKYALIALSEVISD